MFEIKHLSTRVKSRPNPDYSEDMTGTGQIEWALVNLVFTPDDKSFFMPMTQNETKHLFITDLEGYNSVLHGTNWLEDSLKKEPDENGYIVIDVPDLSEYTQMGWLIENAHLKYIEKFGVFTFTEYCSWTPTVQGILQEIRLLQNGINMQRTTRDYALGRCLKALEWFWD